MHAHSLCLAEDPESGTPMPEGIGCLPAPARRAKSVPPPYEPTTFTGNIPTGTAKAMIGTADGVGDLTAWTVAALCVRQPLKNTSKIPAPTRICDIINSRTILLHPLPG